LIFIGIWVNVREKRKYSVGKMRKRDIDTFNGLTIKCLAA
jgi:hypothetical protein